MLYPIELRVHSLYYGWGSNPHEHYCSRDFKSLMSTNSITIASNMLFFLHTFWYTHISKNELLFPYYFVNIRNKFRNSKLYFIFLLNNQHIYCVSLIQLVFRYHIHYISEYKYSLFITLFLIR